MAPPIDQACAADRRLRRWCWFGAAVLALLKLVLISNDEIQAYPWDDYSYVFGASLMHWGMPYDTWSFARQPVYNLYLGTSGYFGIPARLWIEFTWIGASFLMLVALRRLGLSVVAALAAYICVLFHPWTLLLFNRTLSDTLYGALFLIFLSSLAVGVASDRRSQMLHWGRRAALFGALAANTRVESPLVFGTIAIAGLCVLALHLREMPGRRISLQRAAWVVVLPLAAVCALTQIIKLANLQHIKLYITNDLEGMPGFNRLYKDLLSIRPANPNLHLSIPHDVREWAYTHSATFDQLRKFLESDELMKSLAVNTELATGVHGEYGAWTVWAIREAAWKLHPWPNARELDAFYSQAAAELSDAMSANPDIRRWTPVTFVPPEWSLLAREVPASFGNCCRTFLEAHYVRLPDEPLPAGGLARVDSVCSRRAALVSLNNGKQNPGSRWLSPRNIERTDTLKRWIASLMGPATIAGAAVTAVGTLIGIIGFRRRPFPPEWYILSALLITAIAGRVAIFSLMDVTGYGVQTRFMFPLAAPLAMLAALNADTLIRAAARAIKARANRTPGNGDQLHPAAN